MHKRVILEGVDGSGKTTLLHRLMDDFHFLTPVVNELGPEQDFDAWWLSELDKEYPQGIVPIHDRFYYSELVYGPILRGERRGTKTTHITVRNRLRKEAFLIHCRPMLGSIMDGAQVNEQMDGVLTHLPELLAGYDTIMHNQTYHYGMRYAPYDYHFKSDYTKLIKQLEPYLLS